MSSSCLASLPAHALGEDNLFDVSRENQMDSEQPQCLIQSYNISIFQKPVKLQLPRLRPGPAAF